MQDASVTLRQLSNGIKPVLNPSQNSGGVGAIVAANQPAPNLVQVAQPVSYESVNLQNIADNSDETFQSSFYNGTGAKRNIVLGGMFSLAGQYQYFLNLSPSAVDFATFQDTQSMYPANGGQIQGLAQRFSLLPAILKEIWTQSPLALQSSQNLQQGYITKANDIKTTTIYSSMCDACDNNNTTLYTKRFTGAWALGKNTFVYIPIVAMTDIASHYTTLRLTWIGEAQSTNQTAMVSF